MEAGKVVIYPERALRKTQSYHRQDLYDDGTFDKQLGQALVAGIDRYPRR